MPFIIPLILYKNFVFVQKQIFTYFLYLFDQNLNNQNVVKLRLAVLDKTTLMSYRL